MCGWWSSWETTCPRGLCSLQKPQLLSDIKKLLQVGLDHLKWAHILWVRLEAIPRSKCNVWTVFHLWNHLLKGVLYSPEVSIFFWFFKVKSFGSVWAWHQCRPNLNFTSKNLYFWYVYHISITKHLQYRMAWCLQSVSQHLLQVWNIVHHWPLASSW